MTVSDEQIAEWRALAQAATPGPWDVDWHDDEIVHWSWETPKEEWPREKIRVPWGISSANSDGRYDILETDSGVYGPKEADATFIAASRTALPALLDEVERLRSEAKRKHEAMTDMVQRFMLSALPEREVDARAVRMENERDRLREALRYAYEESVQHDDDNPGVKEVVRAALDKEGQ